MDYYIIGYIDRDIQRLKEESEYRQRFGLIWNLPEHTYK
jgi:hypothetical protein